MITELHAENIFGEDGFHVGETVLKDSTTTYLHKHDFFELFLIEEGELYHFINGDEKIMQKGDLSFVRPEDEHCFRKGDCKKTQFINMAFSYEIYRTLEELLKIYFDINHENMRGEIRLPTRMELVVQTKMGFLAREKATLFKVDKKALVISILMDCFLFVNNKEEREEELPQWLEKACSEMRQDKNYIEGLEKFIILSGKSQEHLTRCMKRYYHMTPTEYINRLRLEQTTVLLETTEESILDIMFESGFNNVAYFNQLFKKNYGLTPREYRMLNRKVINPV